MIIFNIFTNSLAQSFLAFAICKILMENFVQCEIFIDCPVLSQPPEVTIVNQSKKFTAGIGELLAGYTLTLRCVAAYPVYWDFIPPQDSKYRIESKVVNGSPHQNELCYQESLVLEGRTGTGRTGNYSCKSSLNQNVVTSKYLYIRDTSSLFVAKPKDPILFSTLINRTEWSIHCLGNVKNLYGNVYEEDEDGSFKQLNTSLRYDSRHGFLLNTQVRPVGTFHCKASLNHTSWNTVYNPRTSSDSNGMTIELKNYNAIPAKNFVEFKADYKFTVTCEFDEEIILEWSEKDGGLQVIEKTSQENPSFNHSVRFVFQAQDKYSRAKKGKINCIVNKSKKVLHYWNYDFGKFCTCSSNSVTYGYSSSADKIKKESISSMLQCTGVMKTPSIKYVSCEGPTKLDLVQRYTNRIQDSEITKQSPIISRFHFHDESHKNTNLLNMDRYITSAVFCSVENFTTAITVVSTLNGYEINPKQFNLNSNLHMDVFTKGGLHLLDYFPGDTDALLFPSFIVCYAASYYLSSPVKLEIHLKNGTKNTINKDLTEPDSKDWGIIFKADVMITPEVKSISCSAPLWNSTEWKTVKLFEAQSTINSKYKIWDGSKRCDASKAEPVIILKRIHPAQHRQEYLKMHDVSNAEISFQTDELSVIIFCRATYPILWTAGERELEGISIHWEETSSDYSKHSPCFEIEIKISHFLNSRDEEFVCRSQADHSISTSLNIYPNDGGDIRLLKGGKHIFVTFKPNEDVNVIPCRANRPSALVDIFAKHKNGFKKLLAGKDYVIYNPRMGFVINTSLITINSQFICSLVNETSPNKKVLVTLVPQNTTLLGNQRCLDGKYKDILLVLIVGAFLVLLLGVLTWLIGKLYITHQINANNAPGNSIELELN